MPRGSKPGERRGGRQKGSRNLSTREAKAKFQGLVDETSDILMMIARDGKLEPQARINAIKEVHDRAFGKAAQQIKQTGGAGRFDWSRVPIDRVREVAATLRLAQRDGIVIDHE